MWDDIAAAISRVTQQDWRLQSRDSIGGGCISSAWHVQGEDGRELFIKTHDRRHSEMFAAEAEGLNEIYQSTTIKVPQPLVWGESGDHAYLVMEYLNLGGRGSQIQLAENLAAMHRHQGQSYGWYRDNTIGSTPQLNTPNSDWCSFFREQRLAYQLQLLASKGVGGRLQQQGERLLADLEQLLDGHSCVPSLLHGDLWSGNYGYTSDGIPVIFDPAVYYGDREADLAMTELFGGFGADFYAAYNNAWPLESGYKLRKTLYNLYHILNHVNLFGGGYLSQAESMIASLLSEIA